MMDEQNKKDALGGNREPAIGNNKGNRTLKVDDNFAVDDRVTGPKWFIAGADMTLEDRLVGVECTAGLAQGTRCMENGFAAAK
jgi:hypothetical protein